MAVTGEMTALEVADRFAAQINGVDYATIQELRNPTVITDFEPIHYEDFTAPLVLARSGQEGDIIKGGNRWWQYPTLDEGIASVSALNGGMDVKNTYLNVTDVTTNTPIRGAKLLGAGSLASRSHAFKAAVAGQVVDRLEGIMGPWGYVPAGDAGTNAQYCDDLSAAYIRNHPKDIYGLAAVTGKTPGNGGLPPRPGATGRGGYAAQVAHFDMLIEHDVIEDRPQVITLQGGGNVAAWHGYTATNDPKHRGVIGSIGEQEGILYTDDPHGIEITGDMISEIADNPEFRGPKLEAYYHLARQNQPGLDIRFSSNPEDVYTRPADALVSAAVGTLLVPQRVEKLKKAGVKTIEEEGNVATSQKGQEAADKLGIHINPDVVVNPGGVWMSLEEREINIAIANGTMKVPPSNEVLNAKLDDFMTNKTAGTLEVARQYGVSTRVAACIISQRNMLRHAGVTLAV